MHTVAVPVVLAVPHAGTVWRTLMPLYVQSGQSATQEAPAPLPVHVVNPDYQPPDIASRDGGTLHQAASPDDGAADVLSQTY